MTPLTTITGLPAETADLLAAAGIRSTHQLSRERPPDLHAKLELIAWQRGRASHAPPLDQLEHWVAVAGMVSGEAEALEVDDIPEAVSLAKTDKAWMPSSMQPTQLAAGVVRTEADPEPVRPQASASSNTWRKVDPANFTTIDAYNEGRTGLQPLSRDSLEQSRADAAGVANEGDDATRRRVQRLRSNGEELSRWVKRGVVHPRPIHTWCGAVVSLVWRVALISGIAGFIYLVARVETPSHYTMEVIGGFTILVVLGCLQLHFAGRSRCRICSCNLFYSKNCLKNRKAHHFPPLGYVASLALHLLIFGWFRCMYCGTAIRLKPSPPKRLNNA